MDTGIQQIKKQLNSYKKKYYVNRLIKNTLLFLGALITVILLVDSIEFTLRLDSLGRSIILVGSLLAISVIVYFALIIPILHLVNIQKQISDEEAAKQIGLHFPQLQDKLLNTIQLQNNSSESELVLESIKQRSSELSVFRFSDGIKYQENKRYVKYALVPGLVLLAIMIFIPQFVTESTHRIVNFDQEFEKPALFQFELLDSELSAFKNEDFELNIQVSGSAIPSNIFLRYNGRKHRLTTNENQKISYTFKELQESLDFTIEAGAYISPDYHLKVNPRPGIRDFNIQLNYPRYTGLNAETLHNTGHLNVPEGTQATWTIETQTTNKLNAFFGPEQIKIEKSSSDIFELNRMLLKSENYGFQLQNEFGSNKDSISFDIFIIKDESPGIIANSIQDTTLYKFALINGRINDDYGISDLKLHYETSQKSGTLDLPFNSGLNAQNFFHQWNIDSTGINPGEDIEFFVEVWDNDQINGRKSSRSSVFKLRKPSDRELEDFIEKEALGAKKKLDKTLSEAKELNENIRSIQDELKSKNQSDWKDKKSIEDLIEKKEKLEEQMKELSEKHDALNQKRENFAKPNEELQKKAEQLQQLMEDILDEETKKLYEELQKLIQENAESDQLEQLMNQIKNKEENLQKELERAIEMFKRMQFDFKIEEIVDDLEKLEQEQNQTSQESKDKELDNEQLMEQQEQHQKDFEQIKEKLDELEEFNKELEKPELLDSFDQEKQEVDSAMQESMKQLEQNNKKKASDAQKKAGESIKEMKEKMADMQANMSMQQMTENLQNLRNIVDNLVKLSFDQETIMKDFKGVNQSDPRFVTLSQNQLKLKDDAKIIEDSLLALANRVFQIQSFVTRELDEMNDNIEASLQALRDRHKPEAVSNQQYAMTSINNLALLLDDVLQQMMQQMAEAMGKPQSGQDDKQGKSPQLSELQQELNKKIQELKKSGKSGRELSKSLAELAAEQEMLRKQLEQMREKLGDSEEGHGENLSEAIEKMEDTEMDLVNKNITRRTLQRQEEILTRMLEAEEAMREREEDPERKAQEASEKERQLPPSFEEYLKARQKELDLLHTVPIHMNPYYKEEVDKYFQRLNEQ